MLTRQDIKDMVDQNILVYDMEMEKIGEVTTRLIALIRTIGRKNGYGDLTEIHVPIGTEVPDFNKTSVTFDPRLNAGGILMQEFKDAHGKLMPPYKALIVMTGEEGKLFGMIL